MPWKCPDCDYINIDDDNNLCYCGRLVQDADREYISRDDIITLPEFNKWEGLPYVLVAFCFPVFFFFSLLFVLFLGLLPFIFISVLGCFIGFFLSVYTIRSKQHSASVKLLSFFAGALNFSCLLLVFLWCSFSNDYGPYSGKIVEKETGKPIGGAVVAMRVHALSPNVGGHSSELVYANEVVTNENGEFIMPIQKVKKLNPLTSWDDEHIIIFKPGYSAYPGHWGVSPRSTSGGTQLENQYLTIKIPKLKTTGKRSYSPYFGDAKERLYVFSQLSDQERLYLGSKPYNLNNYWRYKGFIKGGEKTILDYHTFKKVSPSEYRRRKLGRRKWRIVQTYLREHNYPPDSKVAIRSGVPGISTAPPKKGVVVIHESYIRDKLTEEETEPINNLPDNYILSLRYEEDGNQLGLIKLLEMTDLEFQVDTDQIIFFPIESHKGIYEIVRKFENNLRIYFLYKENYELFVQLLKQYNVPYITRTIPNVIGYGIIWDKDYNENVEKVKIEFFSKVLQMN